MKKIILFLCPVIFIALALTGCKDSDEDGNANASFDISTVKNVTYTDAQYEVFISGNGISDKGICWGTAPDPTISGSKESHGSGAGKFNGGITGLQAGTQYYARAYATVNGTTVYSTIIPFITYETGVPIPSVLGTSVTALTAKITSNVLTDGGKQITARGICYSLAPSPTVEDNDLRDSGKGTGRFDITIGGLTPITTYYVRPYAIAEGVTTYGNEVIITTNPFALPLSSATFVSSTGTTAELTMSLSSFDVEDPVTEMGICYSVTTDPEVGDNKIVAAGILISTYDISIDGLIAGTQYFTRPYVTTTSGTHYGGQISFYTTQPLPTVATSVGRTALGHSYTINASLINKGAAVDAEVSEMGFYYSESPDPATSGTKLTVTPAMGDYSAKFKPKQGVKYYYVAFATNQEGTSYGDVVEFTSRKVFGEIYDNYAAPSPPKACNSLYFNLSNPASGRTAYQDDIFNDLDALIKQYNSTYGGAESMRFYYHWDTNSKVVFTYVLRFATATGNAVANTHFYTNVNADGTVTMTNLYRGASNSWSNTLRNKAINLGQPERWQLMDDYLTAEPLVFDWATDTNNSDFVIYPVSKVDNPSEWMYLFWQAVNIGNPYDAF